MNFTHFKHPFSINNPPTYPISLLLHVFQDDGAVGLVEHLGVETGHGHILDVGGAVKPLKRHQLRQQLLVDLQQAEIRVSGRVRQRAVTPARCVLSDKRVVACDVAR